VGRLGASPIDTKVAEEPRPTRTQETMGESYPNRHPFTDYMMGVQLPPTWKGMNMDRYDGMTDPDEHMDVYTTHISFYTLNPRCFVSSVLTSLKG